MNTTSNANTDPTIASSDPGIAIEIKDIKVNNIPQGPLRQHKHYVQFTVGGDTQETGKSDMSADPAWSDTLSFNTSQSSDLICRVYKTPRRIGRAFAHGNELIGIMKEEILLLLGGASSKEISRLLNKPSDPGLPMGNTIIEFSISTLEHSFPILSPILSMAADPTTQAILDISPALELAEVAHMKMKTGPQNTVSALNIGVDIVASDSFSTNYGLLVEHIQAFIRIADKLSEFHPYIKAAWGILSVIPKTILHQIDCDGKITDLVQDMQALYAFLKGTDPSKYDEPQRKIVTSLAQQTIECGYFIRQYASDPNFWKRTGKNLISDADQKIENFQDQFKKLKLAFTQHAVCETQLIVLRVVNTVDKLDATADLKDMYYAKNARFDSDKQCLPGTRVALIDELTDWINSPDGEGTPRILFFSAAAGFGKSAIAHTIAKHFHNLGRLGSSYCFDRADQANRSIRYLFSTISQDLSDLDAAWKSALCSVVTGNRALCSTSAVKEQFDNFIVKPAAALTTVGPIVIVIDALDESGSHIERKPLLDILIGRAAELPKNFRILITTHLEPDVSKALQPVYQHSYIKHKHVDAAEMENKLNELDLSLYIEHKLSDIKSGLEARWPNHEWCSLLVKSSEGLFQWAAVTCHYIMNPYGGKLPYEHLESFLETRSGLDNLYHEVLNQAFQGNDSKAMNRYRSVMGRILTAKEPLPLSTLSKMHVDKPAWMDEIKAIIGPLGCLLSGINANDVAIKPLHSSFYDYLTCNSRSGEFFINIDEAEKEFAITTLHILRTELHFNICQLPTSYKANDDPEIDILGKVKEKVSSQLIYASYFFAAHLLWVTSSIEVLEGLHHFLYNQFLYWLEVLSVTSKVNIAHDILSSLLHWKKTDVHARMFIEDAMKVVTTFFEPIAHSAPHIYISALPMLPSTSVIAKMYSCHFTQVVHVTRGEQKIWPSISSILQGHVGEVLSVAFSPDGKHIVSGSFDRTIRLWDPQTGKLVLDPFEGHTDHVTSVAFSHDGKYIVSGSWDKTIRLWDSQTGELVLDPFEGHTDCVTCVAFSPDGKYIVSGSRDMTIILWYPQTGMLVLDQFKGYKDCVTSVAFSSDGKYIVSGSFDKTIRLWDAQTGMLVSDPLKGHTDCDTLPDIISKLKDDTNKICKDCSDKNDFSILNQSHLKSTGWLCTHTEDLLLWIPPWHKSGLQWQPRQQLVIGTYTAKLVFDEFVSGTDWHLCKTFP